MRLILAAVLAGAALSKIAAPSRAAAGMGTFGFPTPSLRWAVLVFVIAAELALAAGVALGSDTAAYGAAILMALFATTLVSALMQGKAGAPCACFGSASKVSPLSVARNGLLAAAFAVTPSLPEALSTDGWLTLGLAAALVACAALALAVLALAREVGMLRLRLGPGSALEIAHEGPEIGGRTALIERFAPGPRAEFALAVFSSDGCRVCRALEPAVDSLRGEPSLAVEVFSESRDADVWDGLAIPGAPYAIALERDGTVGAKGTFNNLAQLESIVAAAERRRSERTRVEALGV